MISSYITLVSLVCSNKMASWGVPCYHLLKLNSTELNNKSCSAFPSKKFIPLIPLFHHLSLTDCTTCHRSYQLLRISPHGIMHWHYYCPQKCSWALWYSIRKNCVFYLYAQYTPVIIPTLYRRKRRK